MARLLGIASLCVDLFGPWFTVRGLGELSSSWPSGFGFGTLFSGYSVDAPLFSAHSEPRDVLDLEGGYDSSASWAPRLLLGSLA